ncbi:hypothetical protein DRH29_00025 [candidate division Kazan bacterium]|uniref:Uncharacterized protein n=1 Tax=candidate division Kazan bacterium TaxID=2202143 RepID=A0A420ZDV6_UNCK3|nr:MAG: hypothetical protein DRH29_00025 [candidate division Kazan bacterium]
MTSFGELRRPLVLPFGRANGSEEIIFLKKYQNILVTFDKSNTHSSQAVWTNKKYRWVSPSQSPTRGL